MSSKIPFTMSNVAQVAVQAVDASATLSAGGTGSTSVFAGVVVSEYGQPFEVIHINGDNWQTKLGAPYHPSQGKIAEPLRHIADAVKGGEGYVVRVVDEAAKFPLLTVSTLGTIVVNGEEPPVYTPAVPVASAQAYATPYTLGDTALFSIYPKDGNVSGRSVEIEAMPKKPGSFELTLTAVDKFGVEYVIERHEVSFAVDAVDDMGTPTYILTRLESRSTALAISIDPDADFTQFAGMAKTAFAGGTLGDQKAITAAQYQKALAVLGNALVGYTALLGLGCYDPDVIVAIGELASARRIDSFCDIPPSNSYAEALTFAMDLNANNGDLCLYHFPYSARDPHSGGRAVWGLSGVAFAAKADGVARSTGAVGGWHYSPAGEDRGIINRREIRPLTGIGEPNEAEMYKARINKLGLSTGGQLMIDDAITTRSLEDYLRFQHVGSVCNAISRDFFGLASAIKHSPDGLTYEGLTRGMITILDGYVAAEALVPPRNPDEDGDSPYVLSVKQVPGTMDMWEVTWHICVTGSARRIMGSPALIR